MLADKVLQSDKFTDVNFLFLKNSCNAQSGCRKDPLAAECVFLVLHL